MLPDLILNPVLRETCSRNGYVQAPLLTADDCDELLAVYRQYTPPMGAGFYTGLWSNDRRYRERVHDAIGRVLDRRLSSILAPAEMVGPQFAVKQAGHADTECPLHQDWSLCDETRYPWMTIWCPLVDTDAANGALSVVPGSQRVGGHPRAHIPDSSLRSPVTPLYEIFRQRYLRELPMKAGEAVLYDGALTHGSRPNRSSEDRIAVVTALVAPGTPLRHYWRASATRIEVFAVDNDFYRSAVVVGSRPSGHTPLEVLDVTPRTTPLTETDFLAVTPDVDREPIPVSVLRA